MYKSVCFIIIILINYTYCQALQVSTSSYNHFHRCTRFSADSRVFDGGAIELNDTCYGVISNLTDSSGYYVLLRQINKQNGYTSKQDTLHFSPLPTASYYQGSIVETKNNYIISGSVYNDTTFLRDVLILRLDKSGHLLDKLIIGDANADDPCENMISARQGGYILEGWYNLEGSYSAHGYIVRLDSLGNKMWSRVYPNPQYDTTYYSNIPLSVVSCADGGFIFSGYRDKPNPQQPILYFHKMFVTKIDSLGNVEWDHTLKDDNEYDSGCFIVPLPDNPEHFWVVGRIKVGMSGSKYGNQYFAEIDGEGTIYWEKEIFIEGVVDMVPQYFINGNQLLLYGIYFDETTQRTEGYLIKFDKELQVLWAKRYTTNSQIDHYFRGMLPTQDGGFLLTGLSMEGYAWELKVDSLGNTCWFNAPPQWEEATDTQGNPYYTAGCDSMYIEVLGIEETFPPLWGQVGVSITPNPATDKLFIHSPEALTNVAIYNTLGQQFPLLEGARGSTNSPSERGAGGVNEQQGGANEQQGGAKNELSVAHLASGIYLLRAYTKSGKVFTQKFVKR